MYISPPPTPPPPLLESWPPFPGGGAFGSNGSFLDDPGGELPSNWSSLIGIVTAIVGNVLIALALNVQRYAHTRLHKEQQRARERARQAEAEAANGSGSGSGGGSANGNGNGNGSGYGSMGGGGSQRRSGSNSSSRSSRSSRSRRRMEARYADDAENDDRHDDADDEDEAEPAHESSPLIEGLRRGDDCKMPAPPDPDAPSSTSYLRSPYWWLGQVLITVGEMGNFLAYGFAPASIVSPLGVVALISNCVIAPILFKERFRVRDFGGVIVAIAGAVTVVLSAKQEETKLNPHDVWDAITTMAFEIYVAITCALIALLMWASPHYGNRTILIDLGLVGLFGAYTVLATKGVSSMLSSTLLGAFLTPMTYGLLVVLLGTAVMQVRYVNKALQRFDSTQVIPIQFVTFTLSVIIGSAVLYRDFERTTAEQAVKFIGGCFLTFSGVFIITSGRQPADEEEEDDDVVSIEDGPVESINLAYQAHAGAEDGSAPPTPTGRSAVRGGSRRSSRASHVSFAGTISNRPLSLATDTGVPSQRLPAVTCGGASASSLPRISLLASPRAGGDAAADYINYGDDNDSEAEAEASRPLLDAAWRSASCGTPVGGALPQDPSAAPPTTPSGTLRPSLGPSAASADSVLQVIGPGGGSSDSGPTPSSPTPPQADRPVTPSTVLRAHQHHQFPMQYLHQSPLISPSPLLSSTVSTVVADTILQHLDGSSPQAVRRPSTRRARPSLRSSLFVPQDELLLDDAERLAYVYRPHHYGPSTDTLATSPGTPPRTAPGGSGGSSSGIGGGVGGLDAAETGGTAPASITGGSSLRGRARSLSNTLSGLFWPRRKSNAVAVEEGGDAQGRHSDLASYAEGGRQTAE